MSKDHFWSFFSRCKLSLLLSGTEGFSVNQLICQSQQPSPILWPVMPAIEGLMVVDEIRIETGAVKEPEEHNRSISKIRAEKSKALQLMQHTVSLPPVLQLLSHQTIHHSSIMIPVWTHSTPLNMIRETQQKSQ